jgi:hypothetical protein
MFGAPYTPAAGGPIAHHFESKDLHSASLCISMIKRTLSENDLHLDDDAYAHPFSGKRSMAGKINGVRHSK